METGVCILCLWAGRGHSLVRAEGSLGSMTGTSDQGLKELEELNRDSLVIEVIED